DQYKEALRRAGGVQPWTGRALLHLGMCYERLDKVKEALLVYRSVVKRPDGIDPQLVQEARADVQRLDAQLASLLNPTDTKWVLAGGTLSAAVQKDGSMLWWGASPTINVSLRPSVLEDVANAASAALGSSQLFILSQDGSVTQRGNGSSSLSGLTDIMALASGGGHTLALKNDGTVW